MPSPDAPGALSDRHAQETDARPPDWLGAADPEPSSDPGGIDKSALTIAAPRRRRDKAHLRFVASQPCLLCGRRPADPHHIRFAQKQPLGRKVSDEFTVPLCRSHHRDLHRSGSEYLWWQNVGIDPLKNARKLWKQTRWNRWTPRRRNQAGPAPVITQTTAGELSADMPASGHTPRPTMTSHRQFEANRRAILTKRTQFARLRHSPLQSSNWA
jgi:hypothetical protein